MSDDGFDDGLVHGHGWATEAAAVPSAGHPQVADAAVLTTPSSVIHDDLMEVHA